MFRTTLSWPGGTCNASKTSPAVLQIKETGSRPKRTLPTPILTATREFVQPNVRAEAGPTALRCDDKIVYLTSSRRNAVGPRLERGVRHQRARQMDKGALSCQPFCFLLCALARVLAALCVCGALRGLPVAFCALQRASSCWILGLDSLAARGTPSLA